MSIRIPLPTPTVRERQAARVSVGLPIARAPMVTVDDRRGAALGGLANTVGQTAHMLHRQEMALAKEQSIARISKQVSDSNLHWTQTLQQMQDEAPAGAPEFTPSVLKAFDEYTQKVLADASETDRAALTEAFTQQRTKLGTTALGFEASKQREHLVGLYSEGAQADAAALALNPADYAQVRFLRLAGLEASNLPAAIKADLKAKTEGALAIAAGTALTASRPRDVLKAMQALGKGETAPRGFEWIDHLDAGKRLQLHGQAQAEIDRRNNQAIIAAAKRERAAAGALNAYAGQLALGVPPRPEDLDKWTNLVKGSEHEATFNRLQEGYAQVQSNFAKPVAEQLTAFQTMQDRLQDEGGNTQDVMLLELAQKGLAANIQMQTQDPLQWSRRFAGTPIEPLDLSALGTSEGAEAIASVLAQRENTIAALQQQNPGVEIARTLLTPQEAQQLTLAFGQGNARESGQLLQALVQAVGPQNTARQDAFFAQLEASGAGDAHNLVRIADMAAQQARITLEHNVFSADAVQTNTDAAATMLHGREILQANGKSKDGVNYKLPKDSDFMAKVLDEVGAAYGSPVPGDSGYVGLLRDAQVIKQWYVGEAARRGNLNEELDEGLLKQALRATVGEAVDFNSNGKVLMPRGMDETRFTRHANLAIEEGLKASNLWTDKTDLSDYGLTTLGGGRYMITLGDDTAGVTIHIDPNDTVRDAAARQQALDKLKAQEERVRQRLPRSRWRYLESLEEAGALGESP